MSLFSHSHLTIVIAGIAGPHATGIVVRNGAIEIAIDTDVLRAVLIYLFSFVLE